MPDAPDNYTPAPSPGLADPPADLTGRTLGGFHVLRKLGSGGMGQVYLARQLSLKRQVALKFLRADLTANPTALKRFEAEAQAVASLNHPNIVQVYEFGEHNGLRYMALEYVEGRNLRDHLERKGPPDLSVALSVMRQVATALQKAHDRGLVHRDIKPENILVTRKVEVKVTDFGLSRFFTGESVHLTQSGVTLGTPLYLSPEQAQGHVVDHRSDIYSFGVTSYHLLSGEPPFRGTTAVEVALKHVTDRAKPLAELRPDLPADLCGLVHKMMEKNVGDRYQSAREVLRDLMKVKEGLSLGLAPAVHLSISGPTAASPEPVATGISTANLTVGSASQLPPVTTPVRRGWWVLAGLLVVLAGAGGVVAYARLNPPPEPLTPVPPTPLVGLPDIRPTTRPTTTRERELHAILDARKTTGEDWNAAAIELGLLYLRERRLDEARDRFAGMEKDPPPRPFQMVDWEAMVASRLGRAIVLAYRDGDATHPQAAQAAAQSSVKSFGEAFTGATPNPIPKSPKLDKFDRIQAVQQFLQRHPDLAQAVSEAINRNVVNGAKLPAQPPLESLLKPKVAKKE